MKVVNTKVTVLKDAICTEEISKSDNLWNEYWFPPGLHVSSSAELLISDRDVLNVSILNFSEVKNDVIEAILNIASNKEIIDDLTFNFSVKKDGTIAIGGNMKKIVQNIKVISDNYYSYVNSNGSIVKFEINESLNIT